jgi:hypothetical protein
MLPSRQVPAKQLIPDWLDSWEFSRFVTLATYDVSITGSSLPTSKLPYGILRDRLREWDGRMNRQIVGKHWRKREADRMWAFYFLEKPDVNPHWHGLVRFFPIEGKSEAYQQAVFDENAGPTWKELVPAIQGGDGNDKISGGAGDDFSLRHGRRPARPYAERRSRIPCKGARAPHLIRAFRDTRRVHPRVTPGNRQVVDCEAARTNSPDIASLLPSWSSDRRWLRHGEVNLASPII